MEFVVDNAAACGHPLNISLFDNAASAAAVAVGDFARIGNGYGFKATVRVCADTARGGLVGGEFHRGGVVQHQEGAGLFVFAHVGKQRSDFEAVADPVGVRSIIDLFDGTHGVFLSWCVVVGVQAAFQTAFRGYLKPHGIPAACASRSLDGVTSRPSGSMTVKLAKWDLSWPVMARM